MGGGFRNWNPLTRCDHPLEKRWFKRWIQVKGMRAAVHHCECGAEVIVVD